MTAPPSAPPSAGPGQPTPADPPAAPVRPPPRVSVVLPAYNGARYVRQAVDSVLAQTFGDFELLLMDDGSTDATPAIFADYARRDPRVRVVSRPNRGLTNTLNEGLDLVRGPYLARMDADDICLPDRFAKQVAYLDANPDCVLLGSRCLLVDPDGLPIREFAFEQSHEQIDHAHLNCGWPVVHPSTMMRMDAVRAVGGYRDQYNTLEDLDLFVRLAEIGRLANLPDVLLHYRQHFDSVTHSKAARQHQLRQTLYDEAHARRGNPPPDRLPPPPPLPPRFAQHRDWAWAALKNGNRRTARKHALTTVWLAPFSSHSWRVLACALRGH